MSFVSAPWLCVCEGLHANENWDARVEPVTFVGLYNLAFNVFHVDCLCTNGADICCLPAIAETQDLGCAWQCNTCWLCWLIVLSRRLQTQKHFEMSAACVLQTTSNLSENIQNTPVAPESIGAEANARNSKGNFNDPK